MARGNGQKAQVAKSSGKLSEFVRKPNAEDGPSRESDYVDWSEIDRNLVAGAIWAAVKEGGALLFGCSRDKSCYSVKVYADGEGTPYYFPCNANGVEQLDEFLRSIIAITEMS